MPNRYDSLSPKLTMLTIKISNLNKNYNGMGRLGNSGKKFK